MEQKQDKISKDGEAFIKTTTCAPDFEELEFNGIPDNHSGPTVVVRQYSTATMTAPAGTATYFIFTPQPEVALWTTSVPTGTDWVNGQDLAALLFPKSGQIFANAVTTSVPGVVGGSNSSQISALRLVTSSAELNCLNNAFNQYGSITTWKVPLKAVTQHRHPFPSAGQEGELELVINGIEGVTRQIVGSTSYSRPVRDGTYAVTMNREDEFDFVPIRDSESVNSVHSAYYDTPPAASPGIGRDSMVPWLPLTTTLTLS